jgi:hypothetical protein
MKATKIWELFLTEVTRKIHGDSQQPPLEVTEVTKDEITFTAQNFEFIVNFRELMSNPNRF